jgi:excisionase family DNA binding protein
VAAGASSRPAVARKAYPLKEAARVLGVSSKTIRRREAAGEFEFGRLGRQAMVPAYWVDSYDKVPERTPA